MFVYTFLIAFLLSSTLAVDMPQPHVLTEDELSGASRVGIEDTALAITDIADKSASDDLSTVLDSDSSSVTATTSTPPPLPNSMEEPEAEESFSELAFDEAKALCETKDGWNMIEETDKCIIDQQMKSTLITCRKKVYGFSSPKEAYETYCGVDKVLQDTMDAAFIECLKENDLSMESIHLEWVTTCGYCMDPELFNKTDECLHTYAVEKKDSDLLQIWVECRKEIYSTTNSTEAASIYCSNTIEERKRIDSTFDECLYNKTEFDKDEFETAITNC